MMRSSARASSLITVPMCALRFSAEDGAVHGRARRWMQTMWCWRNGRGRRARVRLGGSRDMGVGVTMMQTMMTMTLMMIMMGLEIAMVMVVSPSTCRCWRQLWRMAPVRKRSPKKLHYGQHRRLDALRHECGPRSGEPQRLPRRTERKKVNETDISIGELQY